MGHLHVSPDVFEKNPKSVKRPNSKFFPRSHWDQKKPDPARQNVSGETVGVTGKEFMDFLVDLNKMNIFQ